MAPPVYEPDEAGVEPEVRMGRVCDEDSQAQRHDSVSSVERNVLAVDPGARSSHEAAPTRRPSRCQRFSSGF